MKSTNRPRKKKINWLLLGLIALPIVAFGSYFWVNDLMGAAQAYRSPLMDQAPSPGQDLGDPLTRKVVIVLIDALRYDTSTDPLVMPFLVHLRQTGAFAVMHSQPPSFSAPGWTTILTGAWPEINDSQLFNPEDPEPARPFTQDDIFAAAKRSGLKTAVSGYYWFENMLIGSDLDASFFTEEEDNAADVDVMAAAKPWLRADYQLVLIHLDQVDYAGHHQGGPRNSNWAAASTRVDGMLEEIAGELDLTKDTMLVISDHGQIDRGGHGGPDPITLLEPFVLVGAGVIPGDYGDIQMVDIAPTLAVLLGTNLPASNQGHVLTSMLDLTSGDEAGIQSALETQQSSLFTAYTTAIGTRSLVGAGDVVSATQAAMEQARLIRAGKARIWRNVIAVFLTIFPAYILILRRERKALWFLGGSGLGILLFHLRYAIIDGRTYSLASVDSAAWLIGYTATTAAAAVLVSWLVPMLGLKGFTGGTRKAANTSLASIWFTLYLLAIPILLSFAINGFTVSWTLPEWYTLYIALLSLIQSLIAAALGLILIAISTGIGWWMGKRSRQVV